MKRSLSRDHSSSRDSKRSKYGHEHSAHYSTTFSSKRRREYNADDAVEDGEVRDEPSDRRTHTE